MLPLQMVSVVKIQAIDEHADDRATSLLGHQCEPPCPRSLVTPPWVSEVLIKLTSFHSSGRDGQGRFAGLAGVS